MHESVSARLKNTLSLNGNGAATDKSRRERAGCGMWSEGRARREKRRVKRLARGGN